MATLFHYSDDPSIAIFEPRPSRLEEALVWAVEDAHAWSYCVPRECPRAAFWAGDNTTDADVERFLGGDRSRVAMVIEDGWMTRLTTEHLWRYSLPDTTFRHHDEVAGHWVSPVAVRPLAVERMTGLAGEIRRRGVTLESRASLTGLWRDVLASTLVFSGTRLRNCHDYPPEGFSRDS